MNAVFAADAEIGSDAVFAADSGLGSDAVFAADSGLDHHQDRNDPRVEQVGDLHLSFSYVESWNTLT